MPRDFNVDGEVLVTVKGPVGTGIETTTELGLAADKIVVQPRFYFRDMRADDFGPDVPADVMWGIAEVFISMTLIHVDLDAVDTCVQLSMGNHVVVADEEALQPEGTLVGYGTPLGKGLAMFDEGNCLISLTLLSPVLDRPWRFRACHLTQQPIEDPMGTTVKAVTMNWRAIPYRSLLSGELLTAGTPLWDRTADED